MKKQLIILLLLETIALAYSFPFIEYVDCSKYSGDSPLCDNTGDEHLNECFFRIFQILAARDGKKLEIAHHGPCAEMTTSKAKIEEIKSTPTPKNCPCTRENWPVCDNTGRQYSNRCLFKCFQGQQAEKGIKLEIAFDGPCSYMPTTTAKVEETTPKADIKKPTIIDYFIKPFKSIKNWIF